MFQKNMDQLTVSVDEETETIHIQQFRPFDDMDRFMEIIVAPDQVGVLVKWLNEALACLQGADGSGTKE